MASCEMCGRNASLISVNMEGAELKLCPDCSRYGAIKRSASGLPSSFSKSSSYINSEQKPEFKVVDDFSLLLKKARDTKGLDQEQFSRFLNERESLIAKWEQGTLKPRVDVARRIGRLLNLNLVEKDVNASFELKSGSKKKDELTLGDFIKVRKRK